MSNPFLYNTFLQLLLTKTLKHNSSECFGYVDFIDLACCLTILSGGDIHDKVEIASINFLSQFSDCLTYSLQYSLLLTHSVTHCLTPSFTLNYLTASLTLMIRWKSPSFFQTETEMVCSPYLSCTCSMSPFFGFCWSFRMSLRWKSVGQLLRAWLGKQLQGAVLAQY